MRRKLKTIKRARQRRMQRKRQSLATLQRIRRTAKYLKLREKAKVKARGLSSMVLLL